MAIAAGTRTATVADNWFRRHRFYPHAKKLTAEQAEAKAIGQTMRRLIREAAHFRVAVALKAGALVRPATCSRCGGLPPTATINRREVERGIHAHHPDYAEPLLVVWLCRTCHIAEHARLRREARGSL